MKTTIGGDRLGSGNKQEISTRNYERSSHDLSSIWRSSMSSGTLVPFMKLFALPGDSWEINLQAVGKSLPTLGPLFGSYKVQLDVFGVPLRLYNAKLHMNALGVGLDMSSIKLPKFKVFANTYNTDFNKQINPSSLIKYLGHESIGHPSVSKAADHFRLFNAVPMLAYWDIYKNYYSNKMEEVGYFVHNSTTEQEAAMTPIAAYVYRYGTNLGDAMKAAITVDTGDNCFIGYPSNSQEPDLTNYEIDMDGGAEQISDVFDTVEWNDSLKIIEARGVKSAFLGQTIEVSNSTSEALEPWASIGLKSFDLSEIDDMRMDILQFTGSEFIITESSALPYSAHMVEIGTGNTRHYACEYSQEGLGIKTYQSDLFNNWVSTEWIDGAGGVNEIASVSTAGDTFTIDAFNLASKVYIMLNRIAISGGTYDDWLDAVYTQERIKGVDSPVYYGSLIKELAFEEVVSTTDTLVDGSSAPLGTLAGRGRFTDKHKGGRMSIKTHEPSYILGIVSITPRTDFSQGNDWDVNLDSFDDFHKPALDGIGFQDLITEQMVASDTEFDSTTYELTQYSVGKQPAWINYMTDVNRCYGNFADPDKEMFMTLNRRYDVDDDGRIVDATTYIDPTKFNQIFAETNLDAQNFWIQIAKNITVRRKMSAKIIPNL